MFALELQRRSDAARWGLTSLAAHPGWALTDLYSNGPASEGTPSLLMRLMRLGTRIFSHSAVQGAGPVLFAATTPALRGGQCFGRRWLWEMRGPPAPARIAPQALDAGVAARLWDVSVQLTGASFGADRPGPATVPRTPRGAAAARSCACPTPPSRRAEPPPGPDQPGGA
jgi:hypothetical protein